MTDTSKSQISHLLDGQVFSLVEAAQRQLRTQDLVVLLDIDNGTPTLNAVPRRRLVLAKGLPKRIRERLSWPASAFNKAPGPTGQSFWFLVLLDAARAALCPVNAAPPWGVFAE